MEKNKEIEKVIKTKIAETLQLEHIYEINKHTDMNIYKHAFNIIELKSYLNSNNFLKS